MPDARKILEDLQDGRITLEKAEQLLKAERLAVIDNVVRFDLQRSLRTGIPEIIYAEGKDPEIAAKIAIKAAQINKFAVMTRATPQHQIELSFPRQANHPLHLRLPELQTLFQKDGLFLQIQQ